MFTTLRRQRNIKIHHANLLILPLLIINCLLAILPAAAQEAEQEIKQQITPKATLPKNQQNHLISSPDLLKVASQPELNPNVELAKGNSPEKLIVKSFVVEGSSIFSNQELNEVLANYLDRPISLTELFQVRSIITKLYTDLGYVNSGAYIPAQKIVSRPSNTIRAARLNTRRNTGQHTGAIPTVEVLEVSVLEGKLADIKVSGTKNLDADYVRSRIAKGTTAPFNADSLLASLQVLRSDPLIKNVSAELSAGVEPGTSLLEIKVEEADPFKFTTKFDNNRSPSIGTNRRGFGLTHANLLGFGDKITLDFTDTDGGDNFDVSYTLPVNSNNGTVRLAYGTGDNEIVEDPFTPLDIELESQYFELALKQPLISKSKSEFALGLAFSFQETQTRLLDIPFPLATGADEGGETRISALRFSQEYINRGDLNVFALRSQFSFGLDTFGSSQNAEGIPDSTFFAWRGQSQFVRKLDQDFLFLLRGDLQLSASELVPIEQFRLGGSGTVRGYRQDLALGDNGLFVGAETRIPVIRFGNTNSVLQLAPFVDLGAVWNSDDTQISNDFLAAVGIGLNFTTGDGFNARLDWGIPLIDVDSQGDSLQENGVTFSLNWNFL